MATLPSFGEAAPDFSCSYASPGNPNG